MSRESQTRVCCECCMNANQMVTKSQTCVCSECLGGEVSDLLNDIRMVTFVLADCDELHRAGHMDGGTFGAVVALAVSRLHQTANECRANAD